jgi:NAD-reducing hydrogenase large subunit
MRKYGQEVIKRTAGKKIHGTGAIPGGINKNLSITERDELLGPRPDDAVGPRRGEDRQGLHRREPPDRQGVRLVRLQSPVHHPRRRRDGPLHGGLRAIDKDGNTIFDHVDNQQYLEYIAEEVRLVLHEVPVHQVDRPENGWYRVGPLARVNACDFIDTPEAEAARKEFMAVTEGKPNNLTLAYHWTRMIETLHASRRSTNCCTIPTSRAPTSSPAANAATRASASSKRRAARSSTTTRSTTTTRSPCAT